MQIPGFLRDFPRQAQESLEFARDYWRQRSLAQGYAEAMRETTQIAHDYFRHRDAWVQGVAGASLGVAQLLGGLPIGFNQWAIDVARATANRGIGAGLVELVRHPVLGMWEGARSVVQALDRWGSGSLLESDSFQIAQEVTMVLGTGALLAMGARDLGRGGRNIFRQASRVKFTPRVYGFDFSGGIPAFAGAAYRPSASLAAWDIRFPSFDGAPLGLGVLTMASIRRPPENSIVSASGETSSPRRTSAACESEPPPALLPLHGRTPEEAAIFASDFQRYRPQVNQIPAASLPSAIQRRISELMERSATKDFEHEFFALELADGTVLHSSLIHSRNPFRVENPAAKNRALQVLLDAVHPHLSGGNAPVRVHAYHSHPRRSGLHADGRAFTETNSIDCRAWEGYLDVFGRRLSRLGFKGRLEILGGAVPAGSGLPDSNPYVAAFRKGLEWGEVP